MFAQPPCLGYGGRTGMRETQVATRTVAALCAALLAVLISSCGGGEASPLDDALSYLPSDAPAAIAVSTDLDSGSFEDLDIALQRFGLQGGVEGALDDVLAEGDQSLSGQVKPLLGNDLVVGLLPGSEDTGPQIVAAMQVSDGGKLEDLVRSFDFEQVDEIDGAHVYGEEVSAEGSDPIESGPQLAVDGDTAIAAESAAALKAALDEHEGDGHLTEGAFNDRLADLPKAGIIRATGDLPSAIDALGIEQTSGVAWMGALKSFGLSIDVSGRTLDVDGIVSTDTVEEDSLPIAPGSDSPGLIAHRPSLGVLDQSQTMRFALDLVRASVPAATFNQIESRLERAAHGSLGALADQFGAGVLLAPTADQSASRSEVRDPAAVARALATLRAELPAVAKAATEGGQVGDALQAARALIPALPIPEGGFFPDGSKVSPVPGEPNLYVLSGPAVATFPGAPTSQFFFGLIGDVFVNAPTLAAAKEVAALKPEDLETPPGSVAFSAPVRAPDLDLEEAVGNIALTLIKGGVEASSDGLKLHATAGL